MKIVRMRSILVPVVTAAVLATPGCKKEAAPARPAPTTSRAAPTTKPTTAAKTAAPAARPRTAAEAAAAPSGLRITGVVLFRGKAPAMPLIDRSMDPVCARHAVRDQSVIVNPNGTLRNVLVRIVKGLPATLPPPPATPAILEQKDCMYSPRVMGVVEGQPFEVRNEDPTTHNIHVRDGTSTLFNKAQLPGGPVIRKVFKSGATLLSVACDQHPWMAAWIAVSPDPWFAVTDDKGEFTLENVPPGNYVLQAWHERYGVKTLDVRVTPLNTVVPVRFAYTGTEKGDAR